MAKRTYIRSGGTWVDITSGASFPASSTAPSSPQTGQVYFDTDDQKPYIWNGTAWVLFQPSDSTFNTVRLTSTGDVSVSSTTHALQIGDSSTSNLRLDANEIMAVNNGATAPLYIQNDGGTLTVGANAASQVNLQTQTPLRFYDSDNSNFVAFRSPAAVSTDTTWLLPTADGTTNQVLTTNGSGVLSWATPASGSTLATPSQQTASYVLATTDLDKMVEMNVATANTVTVGTALNSLAAGSQIHILQTNTGQTTIVGSSVTVNATPGLKLRTQWSAATLVKRTAANVTPGIWVAFGDITA